jgi:DUF1680 family protein
VIENHTYANGGNSDNEFFFEPGKMAEHLSPRTTETCNTYNMLKLTRHLFEWTAEARYADYYENALYNHILASQDPESGMVCYFMPLKSGLFKVYSTPENSFWCCVGTAFESHAKYAESIYYHNNNGVYINLFIPSQLTWKENGFKIRQETQYPESDKTTIIIENAPKESISLFIRYPSWALSGTLIKINGKKKSVSQNPGSYITITRKWNTGDKIEIRFPMKLRLVPVTGDPDKAAVAFGPVLLAGAMGTEGIGKEAPFGADQDDFAGHSIPADLISGLKLNRSSLNESLLYQKGEPLVFYSAEGVATNRVKLIPYYKLHRQRYVVYWDLK